MKFYKHDSQISVIVNAPIIIITLLLINFCNCSTFKLPTYSCKPIKTNYCSLSISGNYSTIEPFENYLRQGWDQAEEELANYQYLQEHKTCKESIELFICSLYVPICIPPDSSFNLERPFLLPCKEVCQSAQQVCESIMHDKKWPPAWACSQFGTMQEDPLCAHNLLTNETTTATITPADLDVNIPFNNTTKEDICSTDLFDCKINDGNRKLEKAVCIETQLVCDGHLDCVSSHPTSAEMGLDEKNCPLPSTASSVCSEDQFYCDQHCFSKSIVCDGKNDCTQGIDEQNCFSEIIRDSLVVYLSIIGALGGYIYFTVCYSGHKDTNESPTAEIPASFSRAPTPPFYKPDKICDIYDEGPMSVVSTIYERMNVGGYSGASSVYNYASSDVTFIRSDTEAIEPGSKPPPPAPPPSLCEIYYSNNE